MPALEWWCALARTRQPGEMVKEFDAYCFDPTTALGAIGVVESELGTHLARLEKRGLGLGLTLTLP